MGVVGWSFLVQFDAGDVPIVGDWVGGVVDGHTSQDTVPFVNDDGSVEAPKIISKQSVDEVKVRSESQGPHLGPHVSNPFLAGTSAPQKLGTHDPAYTPEY